MSKTENMSPAEIAAQLACHFDGEILNLEVSENMDGLWTVRCEIQPRDRRRRVVRIPAGFDDTRGQAVKCFLREAPSYARMYGVGRPMSKAAAEVRTCDRCGEVLRTQMCDWRADVWWEAWCDGCSGYNGAVSGDTIQQAWDTWNEQFV